MRVNISGAVETVARLNALSKSVQKRLVERAGRAALKPLAAAARRNVPRDTGNLRKSIGIKKSKRVGKGEVVLLVGARAGFKWARAGRNIENDPMRYAIPVEYGHVTKEGGFIPPVAFLRRAYESHKESVVAKFMEELSDRIEKEMAK